jgi:LPPG:FO 2-phospho-L-lactate transferase
LGDRDLATHLLRTQWLAEGISLTEVTAQLLRGLGSPYHLLPVTDNPLSTVVETEEYGALDFQEYFVRYRWQPTVKRITFRGADQARMTPAVAHALQTADLILLCPSNPVLSIQPMLAVQGVREALRQRRGVCVAVSPFIGGKAIKGPAAKIMPELGLEITPRGLLHYYEGLLDGLVIDEADQHELPLAGVDVLVTNTLMQIDDDKRRLAGEILDWSGKKVR